MQRADERLLHGLQCRGEPARGAQHRLTIRVGHRATVEGGTGRQGAPPAAPQPARSAQHTFRTTLPEGTGARHASSTARRPHRRWRRLPSLRYDGRQRCGEPLRPALPAPPAGGEPAGGCALVRAAGAPPGAFLIDFHPRARGAQRRARLSPRTGTPSGADSDTRCHRSVARPGCDMDDTDHVRHDKAQGFAIGTQPHAAALADHLRRNATIRLLSGCRGLV